MTTSSTPDGTVAECKRRVDECNALLQNTIVPEYRHALMAMAKAWMKIAHTEEQIHQISELRPLEDCVRGSAESNPRPSRRI
ncbi:hypothetical protein [Bradyrhizobium sp. AZCC 2289]|uniref:hypothetical protein n=1 Tax=Bradyrhizobium sp. AZCC 2289 TaxID=3117026 RepID=UPI002FF32E74